MIFNAKYITLSVTNVSCWFNIHVSSSTTVWQLMQYLLSLGIVELQYLPTPICNLWVLACIFFTEPKKEWNFLEMDLFKYGWISSMLNFFVYLIGCRIKSFYYPLPFFWKSLKLFSKYFFQFIHKIVSRYYISMWTNINIKYSLYTVLPTSVSTSCKCFIL